MMCSKIVAVLKENNEYSLTRCLAVVGFMAFLIASAYLMYTGTNWNGYDTFAGLTGGGGAATQLVNKFINGKYNTDPGQPGKP